MTRFIIERDVLIPMRDGTRLCADIYRPETPQPVPAILSRTPYNKDNKFSPNMHEFAIDAVRAVEAGFAVVFQDVRGRYKSEGDFYPFRHEMDDGFDTVQWVAAQPWCSGSVGMSGGSYLGATQLLAARTRPPALKAIVPFITGSDYYEGWTYQGGAFQLGFVLTWLTAILAPNAMQRKPHLTAPLGQFVDNLAEMFHRWCADQPLPAPLDALLPYYADWLAHSQSDAYWQAWAINRHYEDIQTPALHIGGWYDLFIGGTLENYQGLRARAGSSAARDGQYLIVGPWAHGEKSGTYAEYAHGSAANIEAVDTTAWQIDFFRRTLGLDPQALAQRARVRLFVMGINQWRDEDDYPLARAHEQRYFLTNGGLRLTGEAGAVMEFVSDPADPMPTMGGPTFLPGLNISLNAGPRDNRAVLERSDVLSFFSDVLDEPLEVTGPIRAELRVSCDAPRYDVVVRLCDVHPDGRLRLLCEGIARINAPAVGEDQEVVVDVGHTSNVFFAGHRVGVLVTGASFPRFDLALSQAARCRLLGPSALLLPCVSPRG